MWGLPTLSNHPTKFDGHRYCRSAEIRFLSLSRDHVIKRSRGFEGWVALPQVTTLPILVVIDIAEVQI